MALNRFLFTTAENISTIERTLGGAEDSLNSASDSLGDFASDMYDTAASPPSVGFPVGGLATSAVASAGSAVAGGFASVGQGVTGGLGWLFKKLKDNAKDVLFQEMYVNPDNFDTDITIPVSKVETVGGVVIHPWRPELPEITMSGVVGWIRDESILNSAVNNAIGGFLGGGTQEAVDGFTSAFSGFGGPLNSLGALQRFREEARRLVNSPRKFLQSLKDLVLSPMYYRAPGSPVEQYNTKRLVAFTKQFPDGISLEGYFTKFSIRESGKDPETLRYDINFTVTAMYPIGIEERIGQFIAPFYGTALEVSNVGGNLLNPVSNSFSTFS